jgi:signal transduction histidine kinase
VPNTATGCRKNQQWGSIRKPACRQRRTQEGKGAFDPSVGPRLQYDTTLSSRFRRQFYAHVSLSPIRDENGEPAGVIGYAIDVKARRTAEDEARLMNEELEQRIAELTAQLAEANRQLAQHNEDLARASRMKTEFLARISHELRTPLNFIAGFSELLAEASDGPVSETYSDYVRQVQEGAQQLIALVNDILDLSRIEAGRIELQHETFAADGAISDVISVVRPLAEAKRVEIGHEVPAGLYAVGDRTRFRQILYNLVSNAVKFTLSGRAVQVRVGAANGEVRFSVSDSVIGIPREEHEAIWLLPSKG